MATKLVEVSIETSKDGNLFFQPTGTILRGRKDFLRIAEHQPNAMHLYQEFRRGIPGTVIRLDVANRKAWFVEPLRDEQWAETRAKLKARAIDIPKTEEHGVGNPADWLWAIHRAIRDGHAKVTEGELPKDLGIETPAPAGQDPGDAKLDRLCDLVERLLERTAPAAK